MASHVAIQQLSAPAAEVCQNPKPIYAPRPLVVSDNRCLQHKGAKKNLHAMPEGLLSRLLMSLISQMVQSFAVLSPPRISYLAGHGATGLNFVISTGSSKPLDSSLKRYTAFIKKVRQSIGAENRDQLLRDIETLSLEKYVDELDGAVLEGISRCKSEKDIWSAVEVRFRHPIVVYRPSHAENVDLRFSDHQRDSSSFPKDFYT